MKISLRLFLITTLFTYRAWAAPKQVPVIKAVHPQQLLVVITNGWNTIQGRLYGFKYRHSTWVLQFRNPVVVGCKGLGLGDGMVKLSIANVPLKKEGDNKSPAGFFTIGTAFGYADYKDAKWINNPYVKASDTLICVDDAHSAYYNTLINKNLKESDWKSYEEMLRKDNAYKWGLFINYNADKPVAGRGSCIFMHIWNNSHKGTAGCTAMKENDILNVLHWINAQDNPLLVQLPKQEYMRIRVKYKLPEINF